jgi:hypothetical protein
MRLALPSWRPSEGKSWPNQGNGERFGDCRRGRSVGSNRRLTDTDAAALQLSLDRLGVQPHDDDGSLRPCFTGLGDSGISVTHLPLRRTESWEPR